MISAINLDMLTGEELFKEINIIVGEGLVKKIEEKVLSEGGWNVKDIPEKIFVGQNLLNDTVRLPKKQPFKNCEIAINAVTYHLLVKISNKDWQDQWWQTKYTIHTRKPEVNKT